MRNAPTNSAMLVGRNIAERREDLGLTRAQLADRLGVTTVAIYYWETGMRGISGAKLPEVAAALHCTVGDLYASE